MSNTDNGAGVGLRRRRGLAQVDVQEPDAQVDVQEPDAQVDVQEPIISNRINSLLSSTIIEKAQNKLKRLNSSNQISKRQEIKNKFSDLISDTGAIELEQEKKTEIENGILAILGLGVENSENEAEKKIQNLY